MYKYGVGEDANGGRPRFIDMYSRRIRIGVPIALIVIGTVLLFVQSGICHGIGGNLIAAGLVAAIIFIAYEDVSGQQSQAQARDQMILLEKIDASTERLEEYGRLENVAKKVGLDECHRERPGIEIREAVLAAKAQVDILEVSLDTMLGMDADEWEDCDARVRIILLDPKFPTDGMTLATLRDREENELLHDKILSEVHATLRSLPEEWSANTDDDLDSSKSGVRLAQLIPTMSYFRIDGTAYFAPLIHKRLGNETMHMEFEEEGDFFKLLADNFEALWKNTKKVKHPDPEYLKSDPAADGEN